MTAAVTEKPGENEMGMSFPEGFAVVESIPLRNP
jgi:hypothetical protein